ncbi:MAG: N-acetyl-gamma-glutamyl-phosphate reductase [Gammaproteobacteria bacterium]|nr:N-acetyl-gamma-glutamyl-phosphate reductase [Gammaproteobacteria bacterium]
MQAKIRVGVVGGTGYTGVELLRLLSQHSFVDLVVITSGAEAGIPVGEFFPSLGERVPLRFSPRDSVELGTCDLVFFATPNGVAMRAVPELLAGGCRVIDLAADFRLTDSAVWAQWYGEPHACPELLAEAVYGLPEINRERISSARLVANPGCYPTAVALALLPLVESGVMALDSLIADCKSGYSGAGRQASIGLLAGEISESFKAYAVSGHRHQPEIEQTLRSVSGAATLQMTFVPHLVPMVRGIHATCYGRLIAPAELQTLYEQRYQSEVFVDVLPAGAYPETRHVRGANQCRLAVHQLSDDRVVVLSVIDNLVKGAAGQALQNMNLMFGLPETEGLQQVALVP